MRLAALLLLAGCFPRDEKKDEAPIEGLEAIFVSPEAVVLPLGGEARLLATGLYADRSTRDLSAVVDWWTGDPDVVAVSEELDREGTVSGVAVGETEVSGTYGGVESNLARVSVTEAEVLGLTVEPGSVSLPVGDEVQLTAWAAWSDGSRGDASAQVRWITGDGGVAQLDRGLLSAVGAGSTEVYVEWDTVRSTDVPVNVVASGGGGGGDVEPNLRIRRVEGAGSAGVVTLSVELENNGDVDAAGFYVDAWLDPGGEPDFGGTGDDYVWVDWVGAGSTTSVDLTLYAGDGEHEVWVLADTNEHVAESDEGDNTWSGSVSTGGGGGDEGGPNLEITYFDWLSDDVSVYYFVDVSNTGTEDAGAFYVDVFVDAWEEPGVDDDGDDFAEVSGLGAGESTYADFLLDVDWCGYHYTCWSWATVDSHDRVAETDEDDNVAGPVEVWNAGY